VKQLLAQHSLAASTDNGEGKLEVALTDAADNFLGVAREALQLEIDTVQVRQLS
jgi:hypothetical protein